MGRKVTTKGKGWSTDLLIDGFVEIRTSELVKADLFSRGKAIAAACGEGYKADPSPSRRRARVTVYPDTDEAIHHEAQHNELVKNMDAGR